MTMDTVYDLVEISTTEKLEMSALLVKWRTNHGKREGRCTGLQSQYDEIDSAVHVGTREVDCCR